jgi:DNA-binding transcriptional MerR regulator
MSLNLDKDLKLYYSITEVAEMFNVNESLLRYWETEFPALKPKKVSNRVRQYTKENIEYIKLIYNLVKVRGYKLAAARKVLSGNRNGVDKSAEVLDTLIDVKSQLLLLKRQLESLS